MIDNRKLKPRRPSCVVQGLIDAETENAIKTMLRTSLNTLLNRLGRDNEDGWFSASDIVGGENIPWEYPWQSIHDAYESHIGDHDKAFDASAKDMGWFLRDVLNEDNRNFERGYKYRGNRKLSVRIYRLVK